MIQNPMYYFAQHVFCCTDSEYVVLLDVTKDDYLCIDRANFEKICPWLHGWPLVETPNKSTEPDAAAHDLLQSLAQRNLLTTIAEEGKRCELTTMQAAPLRAINRHAPTSRQRRIRLRDIYNFVRATLCAWTCVRFRKFYEGVAMVKRSRGRNATEPSKMSLSEYSELVAIFGKLRPLFPHEYLCLFESLSLVMFLSYYGCPANWIFGVQVGPFAAHCWVQVGDVALNDTVEQLRTFTPIMIV